MGRIFPANCGQWRFFFQTRVHGKLERSVKLKQRKIIGDTDTFSEDERSMFVKRRKTSPESYRCVRRMGSRWSPSSRRSRWWPWCQRWPSLILKSWGQPSHWECGVSWIPARRGNKQLECNFCNDPDSLIHCGQFAHFMLRFTKREPVSWEKLSNQSHEWFSDKVQTWLKTWGEGFDYLQAVDLEVGFPKLLECACVLGALIGWTSQACTPHWTLLKNWCLIISIVSPAVVKKSFIWTK